MTPVSECGQHGLVCDNSGQIIPVSCGYNGVVCDKNGRMMIVGNGEINRNTPLPIMSVDTTGVPITSSCPYNVDVHSIKVQKEKDAVRITYQCKGEPFRRIMEIM